MRPVLETLALLGPAFAGQELAQADLFEEARVAAREGACERALGLLDELLAREPEHGAALKLRGHCLNQAGRLDEALAAYRRALAAGPRDAGAAYGAGRTLQAMGDLAGAVAAYGEALAIEPQYAAALEWRGHARQLQGDHERAIEDFTRALELDAGDRFALFARGRSRVALRRFADATRDFARVAELEPDRPDAFEQLGYLFAVLPSQAAALEAFGRALENGAPKLAHVRLWVWILRRERGDDPAEVDAELRRWLEEVPPVERSLEWPRELAAMLLGDMTEDELLRAAIEEAQRRKDAGETGAADIVCETQFFLAARRQAQGETQRALESTLRCLESLTFHKWEWEAARVRLREVARRDALEPSTGLRTDAAHAAFLSREGLDATACRVIAAIDPRSFAARVGLAQGDVVLEIAGEPASEAAFARVLDRSLPGDLVPLVVRRGSRTSTFQLLLGVKR